jgi:hypothetical protein
VAERQEAVKMPMKKENQAEVHKGTMVQLPPKEKTGMCKMRCLLVL